jgi:hypothetical protein
MTVGSGSGDDGAALFDGHARRAQDALEDGFEIDSGASRCRAGRPEKVSTLDQGLHPSPTLDGVTDAVRPARRPLYRRSRS